MAYRVLGWFGLVSVITIALLGFGLYLTLITFIASFLLGILTILYLSYDSNKIFPVDIDCLDNPLQQTNFSVQCFKVLQLFQNETPLPKFDNRITGSETVDSFLNEIIAIIMNDYVVPWYEMITTDQEFTTYAIKKTIVSASANVANRAKCVDWIHLLSTRFPEELTIHLKLFKQSRVRLKHVQLLSAKDINGALKHSPKKVDERKTHRRNKSDTDLSWPPDSVITGNSKFYDSSENLNSNNFKDIFFDLECSVEDKQMCRDTYCMDSEKEYALLCEVAETVLYLIAPEDAWSCHALKMFLIELLSSVVLKPLISLLSDPDNINRTIIRLCCKDSCLSSELFLMVMRCCTDAEELDATLELVQKDIQKLHSRDSAGEWELADRQKLSSLQYVARIIQARRATLGPQEGSSTSASSETVSEEVSRTLKFLRAIAAWRSNAQYLLEIELNEADADTSRAVLDTLRSSALELCDTYLSPSRPPVVGLAENCHADLVRKITTDGEDFTTNPVTCFDDVQKCVCDALEDDPSWQADFMMDDVESPERNSSSDTRKDLKSDKKYGEKCKRIMKTCLNRLPKIFHKSKHYKYHLPNKASTFPRSVARRLISNKNHTIPKRACDLVLPSTSRHNRSRSDIVGNFAAKMMTECAGPSNLRSANTSNLSLSHSSISQSAKNMMSPLSALIIETGKCKRIMKTCLNRLPKIFHKSKHYKYHLPNKASTFPRSVARRLISNKNKKSSKLL